jgi:lysyl oxidase
VTSRSTLVPLVALLLLPAVALALLAAGVGSDVVPEAQPPVGKPMLPDLAAEPPRNLETRLVNGRWSIAFTTIILNVGAGDFLLRASREGDGWRVEQGIPYTEGGAKVVSVKAPLVWGGDGHNHWHVEKVASVRLGSTKSRTLPEDESHPRADSKAGFCFYDHTHELKRGPKKGVYSAYGCGMSDSQFVGMGLSPGWNDTYGSSLPGQTIDVSALEDGTYRMWFLVDENGWFRESSETNNASWIDFKLFTKGDQRYALGLATGPKPS